MRKEKRTVLTNGRATTMKDLREASWTDRERDKFLDRFNPYEVDDRVDGRFEIDVNTENGPLLLVDAKDKKYSAYLEFTAKGRLHGDDYVDVEKVRYSISNLVIDDYNPELVETDEWLDRIDERGIAVVEEGNVQDEALLKELHSTDGRSSLDDLMEALTLVALDHQWSEGNYDIEDDDYIVFYFYSSEGTKELRESTKKSEELKLKENCYFPSRVIIKRVFEGDKSYFDKASIIVEKWYKLEGACFDSVKDFLEEGYNDIEELADAATDEEERHIVWMALLGYDPYKDEE